MGVNNEDVINKTFKISRGCYHVMHINILSNGRKNIRNRWYLVSIASIVICKYKKDLCLYIFSEDYFQNNINFFYIS